VGKTKPGELAVVGRMGMSPFAVELVEGVTPDGGIQDLLGAHEYPLSQHPPPKFTGQAFQFSEHTWVVWSAVLVIELVTDVLVLIMVVVCTDDVDVPIVNV